MQIFLNKHQIFSNSQFGFLPGYSTEVALSGVTDKLYKATTNEETSFLPWSFKGVRYNWPLYSSGFRGTSYTWIKIYLTNWKQFTSFKNEKSDLQPIICGIPRGSVLGPILFIIYINGNTSVSKFPVYFLKTPIYAVFRKL